ncbi:MULTISPECIES: hypothetical protein [unclassified Duganella]|uniref:hypothetical protein n=1 Tax=unclassified Duganella TaxID=2636909 RepID=UPI00158744A7|nr:MULTISPECIES: hypothetical protein [unclassified Duganella]
MLAVFLFARDINRSICGRKKTGLKGRFFSQADITSMQLEPKRLEQQRQLEPKRLEQQRQQLELLEQQRQQLELGQEQRLLEQLLELEQQELLLFSSKQPEPQPAGRRSAGIFSWVFLS